MAKKNHKLLPRDDPFSIGNILVDMGLLTKEQLTKLVESFVDEKDELLGEYIVRCNIGVTVDDIEVALIKQKIARQEFSTESIQRIMDVSYKRNERISIGIDKLNSVSELFVGKTHGKP